MPFPPQRQMRVLGTTLPSTQTVHPLQRALGGPGPGRPIVLKPQTPKLKKDATKPMRFKFAWNTPKPPPIQRAEELMGRYKMPPGLMPRALAIVNAREDRRSR